MRVSVDRDRCEANAVCCGIAPAVFQLDASEENLVILQPEVPAELEDRVRLAVSRCPRDALSISE